MFLGLTAALAAAALVGVAAVIQAVAVRRASIFSLQMIAVMAAYGLGWVLHLVAINLLPMYLAQVGVSTSLVFTAAIAAKVLHEHLLPRHWAAIGATILGLGLLAASSGKAGPAHHFTTSVTLGLYVGVGVLLVAALVITRMSGRTGGVLLGVLAGLAYTGTPIGSRALTQPTPDWATIAPALTIGLFGLLGFWCYSMGMRRTSVTAVTAPMILLQTTLPAVFGVLVFHDGIRPHWGPVAALAFVIAMAGVLGLIDTEARLEDADPAVLDAAL